MSVLDNMAARLFVLIVRYWRWRTRKDPRFEAPFKSESRPRFVRLETVPPLHTTN